MTDDKSPEPQGAPDGDAAAEPEAASGDAPSPSPAPVADAASAAVTAPSPTFSEPEDAGSVEDLSEAEATYSPDEVLGELLQRRHGLERMPDGPRPPTGERYKRRQFLVDFPLQLSYVGVYVATVTLLAIGFVALNYVFSSVYQRALKIQEHGLGEPFPPALQESSNALLLGLLNFTFVMLLLIGMAVYAIIQSHRVAGPAYRFRRALRQIARRDYDWYLQLRQKDYLHDIAEQLNVLNNTMKAKDLVISDAALRLAELSQQAQDPEEARRLRELATELGDVVLPIPAEEGSF